MGSEMCIRDSNADSSGVPSNRSAELAAALWQNGRYTQETGRIITPYLKQKRKHEGNLGVGVCDVAISLWFSYRFLFSVRFMVSKCGHVRTDLRS